MGDEDMMGGWLIFHMETKFEDSHIRCSLYFFRFISGRNETGTISPAFDSAVRYRGSVGRAEHGHT